MPDSVQTSSPTRRSRPRPGGKAPAARSAPSRWRRQLAHDMRRVREMVTADKLISFLKTMVWVVPLTVLIWVYAANEQIVLEKGVLVPLSMSIGDANRIVELRNPPQGAVRVDLEGPRTNLDRLRREIGGELTLEINPAIYSPGREHELGTADQLNNHPLLLRYGVTARSVEPPTLSVFVDEIEEREVLVQAPPEVNNLDGLPTFDPPVAIVRGPRQLLDEAAQAGELAIYANLVGLDILRTPGEHELAEVPLIRPRQSRLRHQEVSVSPRTVRAMLRVKEPDEVYTHGRGVPVYLIASARITNAYQITHDEILHNVVMIGPRDQINQIRDGLRHPVALLEIEPEDLTRLDVQQMRAVKFWDLPPDVRIQEERTVSFSISRRSE